MILRETFTYNDCKQIFKDVLNDFSNCEALSGIFHPEKISGDGFMTRKSKKALGKCTRYSSGKFLILLNPICLSADNDKEKMIRDVYAHELLHTCDGCYNHGPEFHRWAKVIYNELGYLIDTHADEDASNYFHSLISHKYLIQCDKCGSQNWQDRKSDVVMNPSNYICSKCSGSLTSYIRNDSTGEYEKFRTSDMDAKYNIEILCPDCDWKMGFNRMSDNARKNLGLCLMGARCPRCGATTYAMDNRTGERIFRVPEKPVQTIRI